MRAELLGLDLARAKEILRAEGIEPRVTVTCAPWGGERDGTLRVVYAASDGKRLTAAAFLQPSIHAD